MPIRVELQPGLRHLVGCERLEVEPPPQGHMSISELIGALASTNARFAAAVIERDGGIDLAFLVSVDARVVHRRDYATHRLADGDVVELHMAMVGG